MPADPASIVLPGDGDQWQSALRENSLAPLTPAGVLVPLFERRDTGISLLLTRRAADLKHHAGQVSFPGGRMEAGDADIAATALRETYEEVGIPSERIAVIGYLMPMPTITGYAVTPVVGLVDDSAEILPDTREVETAFEVPLAFLLDPANQRIVMRELNGCRVPMAEYHYAGERIWGATAFIIIQLIKALNN